LPAIDLKNIEKLVIKNGILGNDKNEKERNDLSNLKEQMKKFETRSSSNRQNINNLIND
jgi:hypothetical protein